MILPEAIFSIYNPSSLASTFGSVLVFFFFFLINELVGQLTNFMQFDYFDLLVMLSKFDAI